MKKNIFIKAVFLTLFAGLSFAEDAADKADITSDSGINIDQIAQELESEENLSENSSLVEHGDLFYVIIEEGGKNYLAAFDKNLTLKNKSDVAINGASPLNIFSEGILVTDVKGNPVLLKLPALSTAW